MEAWVEGRPSYVARLARTASFPEQANQKYAYSYLTLGTAAESRGADPRFALICAQHP